MLAERLRRRARGAPAAAWTQSRGTLASSGESWGCAMEFGWAGPFRAGSHDMGALGLLGLWPLVSPAFGGEDPIPGRDWPHQEITWQAAREARIVTGLPAVASRPDLIETSLSATSPDSGATRSSSGCPGCSHAAAPWGPGRHPVGQGRSSTGSLPAAPSGPPPMPPPEPPPPSSSTRSSPGTAATRNAPSPPATSRPAQCRRFGAAFF